MFGRAQSGLEQPGGLQARVSCKAVGCGKLDGRDHPVPPALALTEREQLYSGAVLLCPFLLSVGASGKRLCAASGLGFWGLGSWSFPAWLSSHSLFGHGGVRVENMFLYNRCSTPYFDHYLKFYIFFAKSCLSFLLLFPLTSLALWIMVVCECVWFSLSASLVTDVSLIAL